MVSTMVSVRAVSAVLGLEATARRASRVQRSADGFLLRERQTGRLNTGELWNNCYYLVIWDTTYWKVSGYGCWSKPTKPLVKLKIAGKWMFIHPKMEP